VRGFPHLSIWKDGNGSGERKKMIVQVKTEIRILDHQEQEDLLNPEIRVLKMHWEDKWQCKNLATLFFKEVWEVVRGMIRNL
jgi:hypothetical protein